MSPALRIGTKVLGRSDSLTRLLLIAAPIWILALGLTAWTSPRYQGQLQFLLRRPQLENTQTPNESTRNRFVWLRDGMAVQEWLKSDAAIAAAAERLQASMHAIRPAALQVRYSGGDGNLFTIQATYADAELAKKVPGALVDSLGAYLKSWYGDALQSYEDQLQQAIQALPAGGAERASSTLPQELQRVRTLRWQQEADTKHLIDVLMPDGAVVQQVWPRWSLAIAVALLATLTLWSGVEWWLRRKKS